MTHRARKRFGQNFLKDHNIINAIISHIQVKNTDHWVEIGPGMGALTEPLLNEKVTLDVVELDRDLVKFLTQKFINAENFTLYSADALNFNFAALAKNNETLRIIGNLPYNISTPLLFHLLKNTDSIADMHFMLQKEVVDRICAVPGSKKQGRLTIMMQYYCETEHIFDVPPECFSPAPKVMSAIVKLTPHKQPPVDIASIDDLNKVVTTAFNQRRKTIRNSLKKILTEAQIKTLDIDPSQRAECLTISEFARLSNYLHKN